MSWLHRWLPPALNRAGAGAGVRAFIWLFVLMTGYYLVKPVRNALGNELPIHRLPYLFIASMTLLFVLNLGYDRLAQRMRPVRLVGSLIVAFAVCLCGFAYALDGTRPAPYVPGSWPVRHVWIVGFYLFVSFFNVFAVTMFWSVINDVFSRTVPAERVTAYYGRVAAGGTLGAIAGSYLAGTDCNWKDCGPRYCSTREQGCSWLL